MYEIIGIELVDYVNKKGNQVKGKILHLTYQDEKCVGLCVEKQFVSDRIENDVKITDKIELFYNKYGQIAKVLVL